MKLPRYFLVGDRPVKAVATPDGGLDLLAWSWADKTFARDMSLMARVLYDQGDDVDEVDAATFETRVAALS